MQHLTRAIWALFSIAVHGAIGMVCYAAFVGDLIDPTSAQFWAWLGAWPVMLAISFLGWVLWAIGAIIGIIIIIIIVFGWATTFVKSYRDANRARRERQS